MNHLWEKRNLVSNISHLLGENFLRLVVGLFVSIAVARHLGTVEFGIYNYILSFVFIFQPLFTMGADDPTINQLVAEPEKSGTIVGSSIAVRFAGGIISIVLILPIVYFLRGEDKWIVILTTLYSLFMIMKAFDSLNNYFQSQVKIKKLAFVRNLVFVLTSLLKILLIYVGKGWEYFVLVSGIEVAFVAIGYFIVKPADLRLGFSSLAFKSILYSSLPIILILFLLGLVSKIDQIMISHLAGDGELGLYAVAVKLVDLWHFLPLAILTTFFPSLINDYKSDIDEYKNKVEFTYGLLGWLSILFTISVVFLANPLVRLLYGPEFKESGPLLAGYSVLSVFVFFNMARSKIFVIEKTLKYQTYFMAIVFILNVSLNFLLIPRYRGEGAIGASILAYSLANILMSLFSYDIRKSNLNFIKALWKFPSKLIRSING